MRKSKGFDVISFVTESGSDYDERIMNIAYNLEPPEPVIKEEVTEVVDQQLEDLKIFYTNLNKVEQHLKAVTNDGVVTRERQALIDKDFPGTISQIVTSTEGKLNRDLGTVQLEACVESLKFIKIISAIAAMLAAIVMVQRWLSRKKRDIDIEPDKVGKSLTNYNSVVSRSGLDIPKLYELGIQNKKDQPNNPPSSQDLLAGKVVFYVQGILGTTVTQEQVNRAFGSKQLNWKELFLNSSSIKQNNFNIPVFLNKGLVSIVQSDTGFLSESKTDFNKFISDCNRFVNDMSRWVGALSDGFSTDSSGKLITPETSMSKVDINVILKISKHLDIPLNQPNSKIDANIAGQYITLNKEHTLDYIRGYKQKRLEKKLTSDDVAHLSSPSDILKELKSQRKHLDDWRSLVKNNERELTTLTNRLDGLKKKVTNLDPYARGKMTELEELAAAISSNFGNIVLIVSGLDSFNDKICDTLDTMVKSIEKLTRLLEREKRKQYKD